MSERRSIFDLAEPTYRSDLADANKGLDPKGTPENPIRVIIASSKNALELGNAVRKAIPLGDDSDEFTDVDADEEGEDHEPCVASDPNDIEDYSVAEGNLSPYERGGLAGDTYS